MSFVSPLYYVFLFITTILYFNLPVRFRSVTLLLASYIFYLSFNPRYIIFILTTTTVSYCSALIMSQARRESWRSLALIVALAVELSLLGFTKYLNPLAVATEWFKPINILVPLGISFYTFQTIGYLFDVYRKQLAAETDVVRYALFLSFFPHLLAGPIEPAQHFLPQIQKISRFDRKAAAFGILLIVGGLFKKLVIADRVAPVVNLVFSDPPEYQGLAVGFAVFLARYQIYCDFSGYTDIALGSAQILGFKLSPNFNRPFFATSITDFWRRWHMSLAHWIRYYIFYPLVSTPVARIGVYGLIMLTFLILGLWHGGTINFLIYGIWQGLFVVLDTKTRAQRLNFYNWSGLTNHPQILKTLNIATTFFFIVVPPTLFFRSPDLATTKALLRGAAGHPWQLNDLSFIRGSDFLTYSLQIAAVAIVAMETLHWLQGRVNVPAWLWDKSKLGFWTIVGIVLILIFSFGYFVSDSKFIYMRF